MRHIFEDFASALSKTPQKVVRLKLFIGDDEVYEHELFVHSVQLDHDYGFDIVRNATIRGVIVSKPAEEKKAIKVVRKPRRTFFQSITLSC